MQFTTLINYDEHGGDVALVRFADVDVLVVIVALNRTMITPTTSCKHHDHAMRA